MPFPKCKIHFIKSFGSSPHEISITDEETGIETTTIKDCNKTLPPSEYFLIENQIKAGITLNEVNTNIINNNNGINVPELENAIETTIKKSKTKSTKTNNEVNTNED